MVQALGCPQCDRPVPADAPFGSCPACLLLLGLAETPGESREGTVAVTVAAATVSASGFGPADPDATLTFNVASKSKAIWPVVPGHQIIDELGSGGGGTVYLAEQLAAGRRQVALKVLHGTSTTERERLSREIKSLGRLPHPNIVTLFEVGEAPSGPYFTMEYLSGGSLADRIKKQRPTPRESARMVEAIARAVQAAHERGIRHRDLKPSNVLLDGDTPKVADFGLAKFADSAGEATTEVLLTETNQPLGTPGYMAPEQTGQSHGELSDRTDVYGLGAVLFHCLTGRPPFVGNDRWDIVNKVRTQEVAAPRSFERNLNGELEAICLKCLEKHPVRRYPSAAAVADELGRWQRAEPTLVRPYSKLRLAWRAMKPRVPALTAVATVVCLLIVAVAVGRYYRDQPKQVVSETVVLQQLEKEIAAGGEVELILDGGVPRYARWTGDAMGPSRSKYNDDVLSVVAQTISRVELLPARLVPAAFRLTAVIRHDGSEKSVSSAGFYVGYQSEALEGQRTLDWCLDVLIRDFPPEPASIMKKEHKNQVMVRPWAAVVGPNEPLNDSHGVIAGIPMPALGFGPPREWRTVVVECRRKGLSFWWVDDSKRVVSPLNPIPPSLIEENLRGARRVRLPESPNKTSPGPWSAGGIGAVAVRGQVSVQRLAITRLEDD